MDFRDPTVIKKHDRTARTLRGALVVWAGLSALLCLWASKSLHLDHGLLGGLFMGVLFCLCFMVIPLILGGIYLLGGKLLRMTLRRPAD